MPTIHSERAFAALVEVTVSDLASQINSAIAGFTNVVELTIFQSGGGYEPPFVLTNRNRIAASLKCFDVSNLAIAAFGERLTQFLCLRAEVTRVSQLDRVALQFTNLERGAIAFDCSFASMKSVQVL